MSTITTSEISSNSSVLDNPKLSLNMDNEIILQNNSSDVTISKFEAPATPITSNSAITVKTLPVVYIPTPFTTLNKSNSNIINVNNVPQFQFTTIEQNIVNNQAQNKLPITNVSLPTPQNVILASMNNTKPQLVLQKPNIVPIVPSTGAKLAGINLAMLKPVGKPPETPSTSANKIQDGYSFITTNSIVQPPQPPNQKVVMNAMPVQATNNAINIKSKLSFVPITVSSDSSPQTQPIINFTFSGGSLVNDNPTVSILCDNPIKPSENNTNIDTSSILCDEIIDSSPDKTENKPYDLSTTGTKAPTILRGPSKFSKHGISILKKTYSKVDRNVDKPNTTLSDINTANSVSDICVRDITVTKPSTGAEESEIISGIKTNQKSERRRKSNFSYRKEYDDMEISTVSDNSNDNKNNISVDIKKESIMFHDDDKKSIKEECLSIENVDINMNDECDVEKMLKWDNGIGSLPGSDVKFIKNEFDMVEYVTKDEYIKIIENKATKKDKLANEFQEEMRCLECGCYGLPSEFVNPKYCSNACQDASSNRSCKDKLKKKRKRGWGKKTELDHIKIDKEHSEEEEDETSNENSQDKFSAYPWTCTKKGFSWSKYLEHMKAKPAPVKLFKDAFPYTRNGFRPGMKLEGVDPQHPSYFCVLSVSEVIGYRIRLHFDGYPDNYDYWCNADSMDIFPMGWCEKYGHVLQPPSGYTIENFNWIQYLKVTKSTAAPKHLFCNRAGNAICPNGFRVGMKLEAVDRKNTSLVCVATVRDMMDNRILVHFDSWDDIYDYWADPTSPFIHPVGWCDQYGHNLTPPNDYPNPESFTWEVYLKETKSVAAPVRAFKQRPACGFKRGMRLECVDRRVPQLIRVATVDDVKEHQIRIHFDGWPDRYSYWVDDDSSDIHPIGWCQKTGHPIEPPLTPDDVYDFLECPTVGCRGQGDVRGPKYATHSTQKHCPYAEENIDTDKILPDRLLSPDRTLEAVIPVSREPRDKVKPRLGRPPKNSVKLEPLYDTSEKKPKRKYRKRIKIDPNVDQESKALTIIEESDITPVEKEVFHKHRKFLHKYISIELNPRRWTKHDVAEFVSTLPNCQDESDVFIEEDIDGEAFLALNQKDILSLLNIKVGPAIKLYNSILLLRQRLNQIFE